MKKKGTILKGGAAVAVGSAAAVASTANSNMMAMGDDVSIEDDDVVAVVSHENIGRHIHHGTAEVVAVENDSTVTSPENIPMTSHKVTCRSWQKTWTLLRPSKAMR